MASLSLKNLNKIYDNNVQAVFDFNLDVRDGEIRYKTFVNCDGLESLSSVVIADSVYACCAMMDRYGDGIAALALGFSDADTEIEEGTLEVLDGQHLVTCLAQHAGGRAAIAVDHGAVLDGGQVVTLALMRRVEIEGEGVLLDVVKRLVGIVHGKSDNSAEPAEHKEPFGFAVL